MCPPNLYVPYANAMHHPYLHILIVASYTKNSISGRFGLLGKDWFFHIAQTSHLPVTWCVFVNNGFEGGLS